MVLKVRVVEAKGACSRFSCKPGLWLMQDIRVSGEPALPARLTAAPREGVSHHLRFIGWEIEVALGLREPSCRCQHRRSVRRQEPRLCRTGDGRWKAHPPLGASAGRRPRGPREPGGPREADEPRPRPRPGSGHRLPAAPRSRSPE